MKKLLTLCLVLALSTVAFAQDTLNVPYLDDQGGLIVNALTTYVENDTNASGEQLHKVYKLQRGGTYLFNQRPAFKNSIHLVADKPGETLETRPPLLLITVNEEGDVPYVDCMITYADLTVKNIAMTTTSQDGNYSWANAVLLANDGLTLKLEGCVFTMLGWGMIECQVSDSKIYINNCTVRNATVYDYGDEWCPFFLEVDTGDLDSLVMTNNTFFNLQGSVVNIGATNVIENFVFDHNTLINVNKGFTALSAHYNTIVSNNIFYNVSGHSTTLQQVADAEDNVQTSIISADTLLANEPDAPDSLVSLMNEADRTFVLKNNCYYYTQNVQDYWAAFDSVASALWVSHVAEAIFADDTNYPNFIDENNVNNDPTFTLFGGTDENVAQMINLRNDEGFGFWGYDPSTSFTMPDYFLVYPYPEDLTYSADLTSTDGFHVGSLQWYPTELEQYTGVHVAVDEPENNIATEFSLSQNYPNPFNPSTTINYAINTAGNVKLTVYNVLGQKIRTLVSANTLSTGNYSVQWHGVNDAGQSVSNGIYFYKLQVGNQSIMKKMMFLK